MVLLPVSLSGEQRMYHNVDTPIITEPQKTMLIVKYQSLSDLSTLVFVWYKVLIIVNRNLTEWYLRL